MDNDQMAAALYGDKDGVLFGKWFKKWAPIAGWNPDPDYPGTSYDLRRAFDEGVNPSLDQDSGAWILPKKYERNVDGFTDLTPEAPLGGLHTRKAILADSDMKGDSSYVRRALGMWRKGNKI